MAGNSAFERNTVKRMYKVRHRVGTTENSVMILAENSDEAENAVLDDHPGTTILDVRKVHEKKI